MAEGAEARRLVLACLAHVPAPLLEILGLMVSELVTNAVLYAGIEVQIQWSELEVAVAVTDCRGGEPTVQPLPAHRRSLTDGVYVS